MAITRFCNNCCQESSETSWSERYSARLCMDCYNLICEAVEAEWVDDGLDSEGYPLGSPRQWSEDELKELRRRECACDNYGNL